MGGRVEETVPLLRLGATEEAFGDPGPPGASSRIRGAGSAGRGSRPLTGARRSSGFAARRSNDGGGGGGGGGSGRGSSALPGRRGSSGLTERGSSGRGSTGADRPPLQRADRAGGQRLCRGRGRLPDRRRLLRAVRPRCALLGPRAVPGAVEQRPPTRGWFRRPAPSRSRSPPRLVLPARLRLRCPQRAPSPRQATGTTHTGPLPRPSSAGMIRPTRFQRPECVGRRGWSRCG